MRTLIDFILDLFRSPAEAARFIADPEGALRDAGLPNVTTAQLAQVAATAAPAGYALGGGDPVVGLQRALTTHHNLASPFSPQTTVGWQPTFAPETEVASRNHTNAEFASPDQAAGANAQTGGVNIGFGDITFGNKTSQTATDGGVIVGGDNRGDIVSGDGAVLGDGNTTNNGAVWAGAGSNVAVGRDNDIEDNSKTAGGDLIADNDAPVLNDVDTGGGNGGHADGGGSLIGIGGGNAVGGAGGSGGSIIITDARSEVTGGDRISVGRDRIVDSSTDTSVVTQVETDTSYTYEDRSSSFDTAIGSHNDPAIGSHNDTALASGNEVLPIASGNELIDLF
ncbi:IniB N-terminal domain-containing protein [uncultured Mycolicibacterium sp.]|uniref:IniB N-terminal domain-containing protein n=1 Tax=uncultured Mycolicibacterium sp. TaxID=2320817 RepID=UPI0026382F06|nr:IniB N-terminal domain-containing protein [uncultured Mycolicibacterium sp.]